MAAASAQRGGGGLSLCLASAGIVKALSVAAFTLVWTHSIEKVEWQEDLARYHAGIATGAGAGQGSGAWHGAAAGGAAGRRLVSMEPSAAPMTEVVLGNSGAAGEWRLCADGQCGRCPEIFGASGRP
jgi:hypothetical protein